LFSQSFSLFVRAAEKNIDIRQIKKSKPKDPEISHTLLFQPVDKKRKEEIERKRGKKFPS
jgi:hypothetical protein